MKPAIYGIPNCDSIRKARKWFEQHGIEYQFIDVRETPPSRDQVNDWIEAVGRAALINKRSTTWKTLGVAERDETEQGDTLSVLLNHPTLIKRPVLEHAGEVMVGFNAEQYRERFSV